MSRSIILLFLITWMVSVSYSQSGDSQRIQKELAAAEGRERIDLLLELVGQVKFDQVDQALIYAEEALALSEENAYQRGIALSALELGIFERDQGRTGRAARYTSQGIAAAEAIGDRQVLLRAYELMKTIYQVANRSNKAKEYEQLYQQLRNSIALESVSEELSEKQLEMATQVEALSESEQALASSEQEKRAVLDALKLSEEEKLKKEAELANLGRERAELEQERTALQLEAAQSEIQLREERNIRNLGFTLAGGLLLVLLAGWQRYRYKQQKKFSEIEKQRAQRLEEIDELKDQFLANTSHELRTPLNGIIGIAEALYEKGEKMSVEKLKDNLSVIILAGKRLNNLVNDIMDFSRLKNGELELHRKALDLRSLTEVVIRISQPLISNKKVELINGLDPDLRPVWADEDRLQQILHNLIGNALKFTHEGTVRVTATARDDDHLEIAVKDTGIGISEEKYDSIFHSFHQGDGSAARSYSGTGLGLSITRQLVELHGGHIWVESELEKGSTFFFSLPISNEAPAPLSDMTERTIHHLPGPPTEEVSPIAVPEAGKPGPGKSTGSPVKRLHLLIVDDEPINQHVLRNHLSEEYFEITPAMSGEEALRAIESGIQFDLVLLDIMMPRMSGYEVCEQIRKKYLPSELPVIMVTAKNQVKDLVQGLNTGANDYLAKPFSRDEFLARIKTHLNLHHIHRATGRFVPSAFLRSLGRENITEVQLGDAVERTVTVFFSDIRSYTHLAESMTPEDNFRFVNAYNRRMGPIIQLNGGFVNQYLGDAIMAIFLENPGDALTASIQVQQVLAAYNTTRQDKKRRLIRSGIGFHTGNLIMGIIGDDKRMDAATISDTVNTASRIENLNKHYGTNILLSEDSYRSLAGKDKHHFRFLGQVQVKGKNVPIGIYECMDGDGEAILEKKLKTLGLFEEGLDYYFGRRFSESSKAFEALLKTHPQDAAAQLFLNKAHNYLTSGVPSDWTGVEVMQVK